MRVSIDASSFFINIFEKVVIFMNIKIINKILVKSGVRRLYEI